MLLLDIQRPRCLLEPVEAILKGLELFLWSIELSENLLGHSVWPLGGVLGSLGRLLGRLGEVFRPLGPLLGRLKGYQNVTKITC